MAGNGKIKGLINIVSLSLMLIICATIMVFSASASETDVSSNQTGIVDVKADGKKTPVMFSGETSVSDILSKLGTELGELDEIDKDLSDRVHDGDQIVITRKKYVTEIEKGVVEHETVYYYSTDTTPGKETVVVEGKDGYGTQTYKRLMVDGEMKEETLIGENLVEKPITEEIAIGFKTKPVSDMDFEWEFNENGEPLNAKQVLRGQTATAYTATGNLTSTGHVPEVGRIAVNPSVIPYGSKLFIQTKDGNHIYGYAIASDTGSAMNQGAADVDLYFNSTSDCLRYGVKNVDIFVLE